MGLKGKLIALVEVKCGGDLMHDLLHTNSHHVANISPHVNGFQIHEGENVKVGLIVSWSYNEVGQTKFMKQVIEAIDPKKKSFRWKVIEGDVLEMYSSFTVVTSHEPWWTIWTFEYEKKLKTFQSPSVYLVKSLT
ncbi:MLP-like protein 28 [Solanum tuberosum]|uniref:MLP-like protein 28 n=1 Tax=Solanum tuberosum TaxID=4113 RepID=UPI00073A13FC|nr:PREDICTED: MLP-like protein 28 [Solanum tuberosum]